MMQPSNTPPDGDFVRYLEGLTAAQAAPKDGAAAGAPMAVAVSFVRELAARARRAAEEARKVSSTLPKNKP